MFLCGGVLSCIELQCLCKDVPLICSNSEVFDETHLVLPPAELIKNLNLRVSLSDMTWRNCEECPYGFLKKEYGMREDDEL